MLSANILTMPNKKLFLLDAMALIYRSHFAFSKNPRISSKGLNTGAVLGFTNTLLEIIKKEKPTHIGVAFDTKEPTFRHIAYPEYKAQREAQPEDITMAIPLVKKLLQAFNIPLIEKSGFEADDIIGTLAKAASKKDFEVFMMTSDKDYAQLVEKHIFLYKPAFMKNGVSILGVSEVLEEWGIENVDQVRDVLGLQGDTSDNIPGIPGIGAKTASKLLAKFGSVENLIANVDQLKGKQKENIIEFASQGILSKHLATIVLDVPVHFNEEAFKYDGFNQDAVKELFDKLEFRTLAKRVFSSLQTSLQKKSQVASQASLFNDSSLQSTATQSTITEDIIPQIPIEKKSIDNTKHNYYLIDSPQLRKELIHFLSIQKEFCFDTETTSISAHKAELVGISFSYVKGDAFYVPISENQEEAKQIVVEFKEVLENENIRKIGQNIKYDIIVLQTYDIKVKGKLFDTMLAHYLIEPDKKHNRDVLAEYYLNYTPISIRTLIGKKGKKQENMKGVNTKFVAEYAGEDADITLQLYEKLATELKSKSQEKLFIEVENPLVHVLAKMEKNGVRIDVEALKKYSIELQKEITLLEQNIYKEADEEFNIASPKQLGEILFDKMKISDKPKKTKTGQYATGEEILIKLAHQHSFVQNILDFRQLQKLKSTYIDALPKLVSPKDGLIHTSYNQAVAATGRLSSTDPNLQNIPIRTAKGREIRKAFIPRDENHLLMAIDYSQIELRIMATFSKDETMIKTFRQGKDIHTITASKIYKVGLEEVNSDMRRRAKTANFGIIYGISAFGLAQRLNIPRKEAVQLIDSYFEEFPFIKKQMDKAVNFARENKYVETILGRRRYLRDINSRNFTQRGFAERNAINAPIQGSAADLIKKAMININNWMEENNVKSKMIMQVHDELVFDVYKDEIDLMKTNVSNMMKEAIKIDVPIDVEAGIGNNWLEAH